MKLVEIGKNTLVADTRHRSFEVVSIQLGNLQRDSGVHRSRLCHVQGAELFMCRCASPICTPEPEVEDNPSFSRPPPILDNLDGSSTPKS